MVQNYAPFGHVVPMISHYYSLFIIHVMTYQAHCKFSTLGTKAL